jgi:sensor c-di-GMP phosphodiesterase-like protein
LKIDKSFINKLEYLQPEEAITGDVISMAHKLGHIVVAEGVETERQKRYLVNCGCDKIQGFLISKALDEIRAIEFLKKYNAST